MGNAAALSENGVQISDTGRLLSGLKAHVLDRVSQPATNTAWVPADFSGFPTEKAVDKSLDIVGYAPRMPKPDCRFNSDSWLATKSNDSR